jgi:hypothetical protein
MIIQSFKPEVYRDCKIYYRTFKENWEYLTIINNELFTAEIEVRPTLINRLLYFFGIEKSKYSYQQQINIIKYLRRFAQTTVDFIIKKDLPTK